VVKEPKTAKKAIKYLEEIREWLECAFGNFDGEYKKKLKYVEETVLALSIDEKTRNRRVATKLKKRWEAEQKKE
jgi:hypothetical protein